MRSYFQCEDKIAFLILAPTIAINPPKFVFYMQYYLMTTQPAKKISNKH